MNKIQEKKINKIDITYGQFYRQSSVQFFNITSSNNQFMFYVEEEAVKTIRLKPTLWNRYVDNFLSYGHMKKQN